MKEKLVGVCPNLEALPAALRSALMRLFPVRFESAAEGRDRGRLDAVLELKGRAGGGQSRSLPCQRRFQVVPGEELSPKGGASHRVEFSASRALDGCLRGRVLPHHLVEPARAVGLCGGDEVLARLDGHPVWVLRTENGSTRDVVSLAPPELAEGEQAFDHLNDGQYLRLLPLVHFLRQVTAEAGWERPPLRACLMFDDPNLHWRSYGFLAYEPLVGLARRGGFHVALATVPLDVWGAHGPTVKLFQANPGQVSLLIHGNDHTRAELGRSRSAEEQLQLAAQALKRITGFEGSTGLRVGRVMAPPHGAYAKAGLAAMFALGFEGACISPWSLRDWAPQEDWPPAFGLEMAEVMAGGFPVLPRFRLSEACEATAVISAFLGRPLIAVGHHDTVAGGLDLLQRTAELIDSLGGVRWGSPEMMLRSNFLSRREDSTLRVRPYSARIRLAVPAGVTTLRIEPPGEGVFRAVRVGETEVRGKGPEAIAVRAGEELEVVAARLGEADFTQVAPPRRSWWAFSRRVLCEARDRLQPGLYKVRGLRPRGSGNSGVN